jgi:hypothetical protein
VSEGIEQKHYLEAEAEVVRVSKVLQSEIALLDAISAEVEGLLR